LAATTIVKITIRGRGGHASVPHQLSDPITAAAMVHSALNSIKSRNLDSRKNILFTICHFKAGETQNVYPDSAFMQGTIRRYDIPSRERMKERIRTICCDVAAGFNCKAEVDLNDLYPPTINHPEQTAHVIRLCKKYIGSEHFS